MSDDELVELEENLNRSKWTLRGYLASCQDPYERSQLFRALEYLFVNSEHWLDAAIAESGASPSTSDKRENRE